MSSTQDAKGLNGHTSSEYIAHAPVYHNDSSSAYILPNSSPEHVRLETQARHLSAIMGDKIIHSTINESVVERVLDVGCGTGVVTDYLACSYPLADVVGLDLSPVPEIKGRQRPDNVRFLQGNVMTAPPSAWLSNAMAGGGEVEAPRIPESEAFDLIYSRLLVCGMSEWPRYIKTEYALLRSGGWAEIHDLDWVWFDKAGDNISDAWPWWQTLRAAGEANGLDFRCGSSTAGWMRDAGFEDVRVKEYRWPFGGQWETDPVMQDMGEYGSSAMIEMLWHIIPRLMNDYPGTTPEVIQQMREAMAESLKPEEGKHWIFYVTCGRKPA